MKAINQHCVRYLPLPDVLCYPRRARITARLPPPTPSACEKPARHKLVWHYASTNPGQVDIALSENQGPPRLRPHRCDPVLRRKTPLTLSPSKNFLCVSRRPRRSLHCSFTWEPSGWSDASLALPPRCPHNPRGVKEKTLVTTANTRSSLVAPFSVSTPKIDAIITVVRVLFRPRERRREQKQGH